MSVRLNVIGLMSGTSADGVDAALVSIGPAHRWRVRSFVSVSYTPALRKRILDAAAPGGADAGELSQLAVVLAERFAAAAERAARAAGTSLKRVDAIGSHGQTLYHGPHDRPPSTLQIGDVCAVAVRTGCTTIGELRAADIAAGGQGAPLVPLAHWLLFSTSDRPRAVQNLGGIANVTVLPEQADAGDVVAFDTGPANMVIDAVVRNLSHGRRGYDRGGRLARKGSVSSDLLEEMLAHPFFRRRPPRSTGRREFGEPFARSLLARARRRKLSDADIVATASELTVESIARAYERFVLRKVPIEEVLLCGGGVHNRYLYDRLTERLGALGIDVDTTDSEGVDPDAVEAVAFAVLAYETLLGRPGNVPRATGAREPRVLGVIAPGTNYPRLRRKLER